MIYRVLQNIRHRRQAKRFGVAFTFFRNFEMPRAIQIAPGTTIELDFPDEVGIRDAFTEIFVSDGYELSFFKKKGISTVMDVGANVGFFSLAARSYFPQARIEAYEPNPDLKKYLVNNLGKGRVTYFLSAVGAENAQVTMVGEAGGSIHAVVEMDSEGGIDQVSIEGAMARFGGRLDLLKLDCEGAEWGILEKSDALRYVRFIVMEYHLWAKKGSTVAEMEALLAKSGFKVVKKREDVGFGFMLAQNSSLR